jgi:CheY-like chemotaxis protein
VLLAGSVDEAQKVLEQHHEDIGVLLSDQRMPGKLGVDLLEYCRREYPDIVRMLTTAYSELEDAIAAVNRGEILRYIEKPWGNIDSILIDLNLAATMYEIRKENRKLMDEKLLAGFKNNLLEKLRTLITLSSSQEKENNLYAVESLLRQVAEYPACFSAPDIDELRSAQMFGQPLGNTISAIEISQAYLQLNGADDPKIADALSNVSEISSEIPEDRLSSIVACGLLAFRQPAKVESMVQGENQGLIIRGEQSGSSCVKDWFGSLETTPETCASMAALLKLYLNVFAMNGYANLNLEDDGSLTAIEITFTGPATKRNLPEHKSYDWIDDLMILFT